MGGNVFTGVNRRYSREEYFALASELNFIFNAIFKRFKVAQALDDKEDFGDMDIVCIPAFEFSVDRLKLVFNTDFVVHNGTTWSLIYKEFQLDLITTNDEEFDFCSMYFGLADRANFCGKIAHQLGLKFGHDGLWLPIRYSDSHKLGDVLLTQDPERAQRFLDIVPMKTARNFQEVFDNVIASKYFNPAIFALENNNAISRVRDRKRPHYHKFLELCSKLEPQDWFVKSQDKLEYHHLIFTEFPHAKKEYDILIAHQNKIEAERNKFNGLIVKEYTGLTDKDLGKFMQHLKDRIGNVLDMSDGEIKTKILSEYKEFVL